MDQKIAQGASQSLEQTHILSPQHLQALRALQAPAMELATSFQDVLAENPLISTEPDEEPPDDPGETVEDTGTDDSGRDEEAASDDDSGRDEVPELDAADFRFSGPAGDDDAMVPEESLDDNRLDYDEELGRILEDDDAWASVRPKGEASDDDAEKRRDYMFDSIAEEASLQEKLMEQLRLEDCPEDVRRAAEEIIGNIDDDGFFRSVPAEIAQSVPCSLATAETALRLVQTFDPPGIGASSTQECLLLQLRRAGKESGPMGDLVRDHLDDLEHNRIPKIAKEMDLPVAEVKALEDELRRICSPRPAASLEPSRVEYCPVEVTISRNGDDLTVRPNREYTPRFLIPKRYLRMLNDPLTDRETRDYILKNLKSMKDIQKALAMRESTIVRIARLIADQQYDFFDKGPEYLRPMTMKDAADRLGLHETTVSRAIANKYMATPAGTFQFRDFFTGGYQNSEGEDVSSSSVKEYIREAVRAENPAHPLSDKKIADDLKKKGLDVARRTVAKYREELGIPSSQGRKQYA